MNYYEECERLTIYNMNKDKEIERLNQIVDAYEKLTAFSHKELLEADRFIDAQKKIQDLGRNEMLNLHKQIDDLKSERENTLRNRIKGVLGEDPLNETNIIKQLEVIRCESDDHFYVDLFRVLVNYDFNTTEANYHWQNIMEHTKKMCIELGRHVSFRSALLDYFISQNKILKNPMIIEISIFDEVLKSSLQDELTLLFNRRYFDLAIVREIKRAKRYRSPVALLLFDVDDFKLYNDTHGHSRGDEILRTIGAFLRNTCRDEDIPCRFGGEEFTVVLPETTCEKALHVTSRFMKELEKIPDSLGRVTVSAGLSYYPENADNAGDLLISADRAMYQAKMEGKNKIIIAG